MTKQEADRIIAEAYPKCRIDYRGNTLVQGGGYTFAYIVDGLRVWVAVDGNIIEEGDGLE